MEDPEAILAKMKAQMEGQNPMDLNIDDDFSELENNEEIILLNLKNKFKKIEFQTNLSKIYLLIK